MPMPKAVSPNGRKSTAVAAGAECRVLDGQNYVTRRRKQSEY